LDVVFELELVDADILLVNIYPSELVKFKDAELGKFVASVDDLTTFHKVHMIVCPVGRFSVYMLKKMHVPAGSVTHLSAQRAGE
jgi:hypothetical protein